MSTLCTALTTNQIKTMNDESIMPFGIHKGKRLIDVPSDYLYWLYDQGNITNRELLSYIKTNLQAIKSQSKK